MDAHNLRIYAFIQATVARIEGMKAENQYRMSCGNSPAYGEDAFFIEAGQLDSLAREIT